MKKIVILLSLLIPSTSFAYCYSAVNNKIIEQTITFSPITVLPGTANGTVLRTINLPGSQATIGTCTNEPYRHGSTSDYLLLPGGSNFMLETEIPGIGLRITGMYQMVPYTYVYASGSTYQDMPVKIEVVKIGNIISGEFQPKTAADFYWQGSSGNFTVKKVTMGAGNRVFYPLCTLDKTTIDVPLKSYNKSEFKGAGTTTQFINFSIPFTCQKDARISITLENAGADNNSLGLVPLDNPTAKNTAKGVNVQIYNADTNQPVKINTLHIAKDKNNGLTNLNYKARYYQKDATVVAGKADATVGFTVTYY